MSLDLDWCMNGCGKRCQLGSLYCSSYCLHSAHSQCDYSNSDVQLAFDSLDLNNHVRRASTHGAVVAPTQYSSATTAIPPVSPALSATSSTATTSPLVLATNITPNTSYSLEFRNRSHSHSNKRHHHNHQYQQQHVPHFVL
ncbi:hypothetical protein BASA50_002046 [Batrachochytrium salamandrivorans]|uniref:HIT-type domain-containing protein n=1 Tax=Batrachochytrium salamandrivorans TaxID=1357716 RepID=A0ABQ8FM88_9FUNG|nr:hypothetical protein BASA62_008358 [Batrachochytrium salamandrivorans]KAH6566279.1 hypothetical protein BASA60_009553 [Batrachochytrium salamandrivorans]KAH6588096.1 hypothetical protein BASA61_006125 [Batrachochytrium salamandrivorans]KAH6600663.1 hypothetical protein BASA50_002046 [Batrachochytrium salamandrivorans]